MASFDFGDGKARELKFTFHAVDQFKAHYGKPLWRVRLVGPGEVLPELAIDHGCMTRAVWAALLHQEPGLTVADTQELMQGYIEQGGDIQKIANALSKAFDESRLFGEAKKKGKKTSSPNEKGGRPLN